jgi:integrase
VTAVQKTNNAFSTKAKKELEVGKEISQGGLVYRKLADGTGTWRYDFMEAGERHKGVIGAERSGVTLSRAREVLRVMRANAVQDRINGKIGRSTQATRKFFDVAQEYLEWSESHHQDARHNKSRMKNHLLPRFGHLRLDQIQTSQIESMRSELYNTHERNTVERIVSLLSGVFEHARKSDPLLSNPTRNLSRVGTQTKVRDVFTEGETSAMLETGCEMHSTITRGARKGELIPDQRRTTEARAMIGLALYAGLRSSEVLGLEWKDVDLEENTICVQQTALDGELRKWTKNYRVRVVPFLDELNRLLWDLRLEQVQKGRDKGFLFSRDGEKPYFQVQKIFKRIKEQSGMDIKGGFHCLRHTYATRLANNGAPMPHVQKLLGHSDLKVTMLYTHVSNNDVTATINRYG